MKKIVYATDFSSNAERALGFAMEMARAHDAELVMLHVFDIPTSWNYPHTEDALEMERQAIEDSVSKLKEWYRPHATDLRVSYMATGNLSTAGGILNCIEEQGPGLVVIGTKGGSKVKELIVGSTTKALVRRSLVPVLTVPHQAVDTGFDKVLYASDLQESDVAALQRLVSIVRPFDPEITVAHVRTAGEEDGDERMESFQRMVGERIAFPRIKYQQLLAEDIGDLLEMYIKRHDPNLLAMLEKERSGLLDRMFHHDLVTIMEFQSTVPVLSFHAGQPVSEEAGE